MLIVVAGKLILHPNARAEFIAKSIEAIKLARCNDDCLDFSVSADPIEVNRVNIFEKWKSITALNEFRDAAGNGDLFLLVKSFDVNEYEINT